MNEVLPQIDLQLFATLSNLKGNKTISSEVLESSPLLLPTVLARKNDSKIEAIEMKVHIHDFGVKR